MCFAESQRRDGEYGRGLQSHRRLSQLPFSLPVRLYFLFCKIPSSQRLTLETPQQRRRLYAYQPRSSLLPPHLYSFSNRFFPLPDYPLGYRHLDPIYEAYVAWLTSQIQPTIALHGFCFVAWCVSMGHLRRITEQRPASSPSGPWKRVSSRLERWSPSEQIFPTGPGTKAFLESKEWKRLYDKYEAVFREDGGANMEGVGVVEKVEGTVRRATLVIDLEVSPFSLFVPFCSKED